LRTVIVVDKLDNWPLHINGVEVVSSKEYLTGKEYDYSNKIRIFNLCRSYGYQTYGYYVSLLAAARGHKPIPSIATINEMKNVSIVKIANDDIDELLHKSLKQVVPDRFILSIYFGKNLGKKYDPLAKVLYATFPIPFMRAEFRKKDNKWQIQSLRPISANEIPESHHEFVISAAEQYFSSKRFFRSRRKEHQYDIAILFNPDEDSPPSYENDIKYFIKAAEKLGMHAEVISKEDYPDLGQYDGLFIRETTSVNHHTYRFARKAVAEGLIVIDDPDSIEKCANKVFLAELLSRHHIPHPKTLIAYKANRSEVLEKIKLPCVLKEPDGSFSTGVFKANTEQELNEHMDRLLKISDLIITQEFLPTGFDWRVVMLDRKPLLVCKYHMVDKHWQIQRKTKGGNTRYGKVETMTVEEAPEKVVHVAARAANAIGDGLYGVDLKQSGDNIYVIEVNDNPNLELGYEGKVLKEQLFIEVMKVFQKRIEERKQRGKKE